MLEMWKELKKREVGDLQPTLFAKRIRSDRVSNIEISNQKELLSPHRGAVNSLQIDLTDNQYLLSGASDGSAAVFDIQNTGDYECDGLIAKHKCLFVVDKNHHCGHKYAVSSVAWYPIDTGLFVTASFDHYVKVWDTNTTQIAMDFKMPGKVNSASMSTIATSHMLIAAGSSDVQVRLCDIASGAFTHTLSGHRDGIMAVEWSLSSEWVLMSGGCDGAIRFWDIRRAGCFLVLDQSLSQLGRRPPLLKNKSDEKRTAIVKDTRKSPKTGGGYSTRLPSGKRLHPGMASCHNRATAHYGVVTSLRTTEDGMHLISSGSDSRLRLWDIESGRNTLVNFEATHLQTSKKLQLAVTDDSSLVFVPCMKSIKAYDIWSGMVLQTYRGHYEFVNSCCFNSRDQELYTGSNDRQILIWSPPNVVIPEEEETSRKSLDIDCWSD